MAYTQEQCIAKIQELYNKGNLSKLYDMPYIRSWNGKTPDTKEEYQEIFAQYILERLIDGKLPMVSTCNVKEYCKVDRHHVERDNEEGVQREFYSGKRKLYAKYGKPIWFELPAVKNGQGKGIDLVYYDETTSEINIFELKCNGSKETLLRAVLEIQTYYQRVDWYKAVTALKERGLIKSDYVAKINKYVLFDASCKHILKKYSKLTENSFVQKLMEEFNVGVVTFE